MSETEEAATYDFDEAFQERIATMMVRDTTFALRANDLIQPEYFTTEATQNIMRVVQEHLKVYRTAPDISLMPMLIKDAVNAKRIRKDTVPEIRDLLKRIMHGTTANPGFVMDRVSDFAKHQAMEHAILDSVGLLEKGEFAKIAERMKSALAVGDVNDGEDYDYFKEIESRTKQREDIAAGKVVKTGITSGYSAIDAHLYHAGWGRKELSCVMGPAKSGKSLSLGDFCKNASLAGYNVLYVSLEVAKEIISNRIDAALSSTMMNELHKHPDDVKTAIQKAEAGAGIFKLQDRPSGTMKPSHLQRMIEKYRAEGIIFDLIAVDYADIMASEYRSDDLRENLRTIYIDLRALAHEYNVAMLTATQTNRDGAKSVTAKATDVGDDWNKARTVDILIGINATDAEKRAGEARLYWALSRNTEDGFTLRIKQNRQKMQFIEKVLGKE
ncbi:DnaB-like helicase C-terminal domain-containing protein [Phaeobacter gallaeciensis]|uniref:DnaB-like helicase C-terminal domain-containing protein n=1 Tax=Phaeobacter gallaeciensis TaxID=60890 RepID=UPI0023800F21|nr:DnaB-like helicase C-terminal domain-containing protein [Phaeobacter gallaeciensis]MDE4297070.1 DnaB-like helicase C-terminal domain-containing protein [Phaeobacter gallaeciensis]